MSGDPSSPGAVPQVIGFDEQDTEPVDLDRWTALARAVLVDEGLSAAAELSLSFVAADAIAELNEEHLGKAGPTDVLSFPLDDPDEAVEPGMPLLLGDVIVCPSVARAQAPDHAGDYDDELALLVVHGVLHVLGHDHAEDDERHRMQERERAHLARHHRPLPDTVWTSMEEKR